MILGNITRCIGDFNGLERALLFRYAIDFDIHKIICQYQKCAISPDELIYDDWQILELGFNFSKLCQ